jgi:arsenate reductase (thioredoxin)
MEGNKEGRKMVLFLCTHNSARSQIAEGLLNSLFGDEYEVFSAGLEPSGVHYYAVRVMHEIGIDIYDYRSKSIDNFIEKFFDYVITVCDNAKEACPYFPHGKAILHKGFDDPALISGTEDEKLAAFRRVRDEIKEWLTERFGGSVKNEK